MDALESILCHAAVTQMVFCPRNGSNPSPYEVESSGATLSCCYEERVPDGFTIVFFHGNGELVEDYAPVLPSIFEIIGCNTFIAEYRGYGQSTGYPDLLNFLTDAESIARSLPCPNEKVILFGRSLGCLQAIHAVQYLPGCRGLILESGIADLAEYLEAKIGRYRQLRGTTGLRDATGMLPRGWVHSARTEAQKHFDHRTKLSGYKGRSLVVHAIQDIHMPIRSSGLLFEWLPDPKKLKLMERGNHNSIFALNTQEYCELIREKLIN